MNISSDKQQLMAVAMIVVIAVAVIIMYRQFIDILAIFYPPLK